MHQESQTVPRPRHSGQRLMALIVAFSLGMLALAVGLTGLLGRGSTADQATVWLNLVTGLTGVAGAIGYMLGKRWARYSYGASVLGHLIAHGRLLLNAIAAARVSLGAIIGLSLVPALAAGVFIWLERQRRG